VLLASLLLGAFLAGSIPFGLLIGLARGIDIRQHGSKNIGATNCGRVLGRPLGVLCFLLDFLKGFLPVLGAGFALGAIGRADSPAGLAWSWLAVVVAAVMGHMFSPWIGFKGGKGVATGFGGLMGVWPVMTIPALLALVVWAVFLRATRYMGLSSCLAAMCLPLGVLALPSLGPVLGLTVPGGVLLPHLTVSTVLAAFVVYRHRGNLARTWAGTELRIGGPAQARPAPSDQEQGKAP